VSGVEPMSHAFPLANVMRPDEAGESLTQDEALQNAPSRSSGLFVVPNIVE
jgi:aspartyl-tRNA(Asn)/glutamyl-tRNA(Gln) amidotransferase subunit C